MEGEGLDKISGPVAEFGSSILIVVMGVSGTGKSTLGSALARELGLPYIEGDELHPRANIDKMAAGIALDDADREPWLQLIRTTAEHAIVEHQEQSTKNGDRYAPQGAVVTCSALKRYYREILRGNLKLISNKIHRPHRIPEHLEAAHPAALRTFFVFIDGKRDLLMDRMTKRAGHFMRATMLDSQLSTLESPVDEPGVVVVSIEDSTEEQVRIAKEGLARLGALLQEEECE